VDAVLKNVASEGQHRIQLHSRGPAMDEIGNLADSAAFQKASVLSRVGNREGPPPSWHSCLIHSTAVRTFDQA